MKYRIERDFLGKVRVPANAYYGVETERAKENYQISGIMVPIPFIKNYAIIKKCAAIANMKIGKLDERRCTAIVRACDEVIKGRFDDQFVIDVYQSGAGTSVNMNVNEVVANRAIELLGGKKGDYKIVHPNDHVNMSQSTNDTYPAAMHLSVYSALRKELIPALGHLHSALLKKSAEFSKIVKIGRTHLQDAVPITLGQEFSGYASSLLRETKHIEEISEQLLYLPLGGTAVGTGIEASRKYSKEVINEIAKCTRVKYKSSKNFFDIQQNQNEEQWISSSLKDLAISLNKLGNDIRLMASGPVAGFSDILLPPPQPGSSIMPGKVNPSMPEMLNMVCFQIIGSDSVISNAAQSGQLELNVYMPLIMYNLLNSISILSKAVATFTDKCVLGIKANTKRIKANLDKDISVATALATYIGYSRAAEIAKKAKKESKSVKEVCMEMKLFDKKKLDKILDPRRLTKMS